MKYFNVQSIAPLSMTRMELIHDLVDENQQLP